MQAFVGAAAKTLCAGDCSGGSGADYAKKVTQIAKHIGQSHIPSSKHSDQTTKCVQ